MKRSTAVLLFLSIIGLTVLLSSCGNNNDSFSVIESPKYPYEWDTVHYNQVLSYTNSDNVVRSSIIPSIVSFNEEYIKIYNVEYPSISVTYIGYWSSKNTFITDFRTHVITVNLKTKVLTIQTQEDKEIFIK